MHDRLLWAGFALAATLAVTLAGCSASSVIDKLPANIGLPAGAPERPVAPYQYPAVHDMPPDRPTATMTEQEQVRLERDLANARDHQEGRPQPAKKGASARKLPDNDDDGQAAGSSAKP